MKYEFDPSVTYYLCSGLARQGATLSNGKIVDADGDKVGDVADGQLVEDGEVVGHIEGLVLTLTYTPGNGVRVYELIPKEDFE